MKPNLPVSRLAAPQRPATGITHQPGVLDRGKESPGGQVLSRDGGGVSLKVERHSQWALLSRAQTQLSDIQSSERAIVASYRELLSLSRQMERSGAKSEALATRVATLRQQVERNGALDNNLKLQENPPRNNFRLDRVDLLSRRDQRESLSISLPNGRQVDVRLEAGAGPDQNLARLQSAFGKHRMALTAFGNGELRVRGTEAQLASPWVFRGQGVRVPAGNPVPIQLSREQTELGKLENDFRNGDRALQKQRLKELLATLEQERRNLENQRQQLMREIHQMQANAAPSAGFSEQASGAMRSVLAEGDFTLQLNTLLAQANVSRFSVVALLGR